MLLQLYYGSLVNAAQKDKNRMIKIYWPIMTALEFKKLLTLSINAKMLPT